LPSSRLAGPFSGSRFLLRRRLEVLKALRRPYERTPAVCQSCGRWRDRKIDPAITLKRITGRSQGPGSLQGSLSLRGSPVEGPFLPLKTPWGAFYGETRRRGEPVWVLGRGRKMFLLENAVWQFQVAEGPLGKNIVDIFRHHDRPVCARSGRWSHTPLPPLPGLGIPRHAHVTNTSQNMPKIA
jgi:hypothetical protein